MNKMRKLLSILLVLCMLMSWLPMGAFATETDDNQFAEPVATDATNATDATDATDATGATNATNATDATDATGAGSALNGDADQNGNDGIAVINNDLDTTAADGGLGLTYVNAPDISGDPLYKILHLDAGRKYISAASLKQIVAQIASMGMNQLHLYLSDNQGLRFAPTNEDGEYFVNANNTTYDMTEALGYYDNKAAEPTKDTDYVDSWITPAEMVDLIRYADGLGVEIIPCINMPGHMAAILQGSGDERVAGFAKTFGTHYSNESLDMGDVEAVNFALQMLADYVSFFSGIKDSEGNQLVRFFSIGADEYGQDIHGKGISSGFGTAYMNENGEYDDLVNFLNRAGNVIKSFNMKPCAFNDPFLSDNNTDAEEIGLNTDWLLYYWGGGWGGMINASPSVLDREGFDVVNTNSEYYFICCQSRPYGHYLDTVAAVKDNPFELQNFATGSVNFEPAGAMYCIWCDHCPSTTAEHASLLLTDAMPVIRQWLTELLKVPEVTYDYVELTDGTTGVKIGATGLSDISVTAMSSAPAIAGAASGKVNAYSVAMLNEQQGYSGGYKVYIPIPAGWDAAKVYGFTMGELVTAAADGDAALPIQNANGSVQNGNYVMTVSDSQAMVGIYQLADVTTENVVNITLTVGDTYDTERLAGDYQSVVGDRNTVEISVANYEEEIVLTAVANSSIVSGSSYLISDGNGNFLTLNGTALANSTDASTATKWTFTKLDDGTFAIHVDSVYLTINVTSLQTVTIETGDGGDSGDSGDDGDTGDAGDTTTSYPAWDSSKVYTAGDIVSYNGKLYKAKNWTQGEVPGASEWGSWAEYTESGSGSGSGSGSDSGSGSGTEATIPGWSYGTANGATGYYMKAGINENNIYNYYLDYNNGWSAHNSNAGTIHASGEAYILATNPYTTLKFTAERVGTETIVIGNTTYNITVNAAVSSAKCDEHGITVSGSGVNVLDCQTATINTATIPGYTDVTGIQAHAFTLTPKVGTANYTGDVLVEMKIPEAWITEGGVIRAFVVQDGTVVEVPVTIEDGVATYSAPGGAVSGLFKLPAGYFNKEVTVIMGNNSSDEYTQSGEWTTQDVYYCDDKGLVTVTSEVTAEAIPAIPEGITTVLNEGASFYITDGNGNYLSISGDSLVNVTNMDDATLWEASEINSEGRYNIWGDGHQLYCLTWAIETVGVATTGQTWNGCMFFDSENGLGLYQVSGSNTRYLVFNGTNWVMSADVDGHSQAYGIGSKAEPAESTVTITSGETLGTTSVVVGTTKYNITIADSTLVNTQLTIPYMITNHLVNTSGDEDNPVTSLTINAAWPDITTEDGINLEELIPASGNRNNDPMNFWHLTWLPNGSRQSTASDSPYGSVAGDSSSGMFKAPNRVQFRYIRYNLDQGRWEFKLEIALDKWYTGTPWGTDVDLNGTIDENETEGWYPVSPTETDVTALGMPGVTAGEGQVVAYFIQPTDITQEVETSVVDWGPSLLDTQTNNSEQYGANYVLLDFAVRYEGGSRNPDEVGSYPIAAGGWSTTGVQYDDDKTMTFHCVDGWGSVENDVRTVHGIQASDDSIDGYEIYMITVMDSSTELANTKTYTQNIRVQNADGTYSGGYDYDASTEQAIWLLDEDTVIADEDITLHTDIKYADDTNGIPYVEAVHIQNRHAKLITYYVRYVGNTEDDIHVHYVNRTLGDLEFYNYTIHVASGTLFNEGFAMNKTEADPFGLVNNSVVNYYDIEQVVQGDPRNIVDGRLPSFYRSTELQLVEVKRSEDGKDVYLYYYTLNNKSLVIDFGLPVELTTTALQINLNDGETLNRIYHDNASEYEQVVVNGETYIVSESEYGYYVTTPGGRMFYVPTSVMHGSETVHIKVDTSESSSTNANRYYVDIHPATTVYYEEYFAAYIAGEDGGWTGTAMLEAVNRVINAMGTAPVVQQSAHPGMTNAYNYGYDPVYSSAAPDSVAQTTTPGDKLTFTFTGDGVEIYARCTSETGVVMVTLYDVVESNNETIETIDSIYLVDTLRKDGTTSVTTGQASGNSDNTPIVSLRDLDYGKYKVVIYLTNIMPEDNQDAAEDEKPTRDDGFIFDGFRVFNTMDTALNTVYNEDDESNPDFAEIRDSLLFAQLPTYEKIKSLNIEGDYIQQIAEDMAGQIYSLNAENPITAVLLAQNESVLTTNVQIQSDYTGNGPKNEVYIYNNQSLTITMPDAATAASAQIGIKSLDGIVTLNGKTIPQTNMYYGASSGLFTVNGETITIVNNSGNTISVTDIKVPGGIPENEPANQTVMMMAPRFMRTMSLMGYRDIETAPAKEGIVEEDGKKYYYVDGEKNYAGLIEIDGSYYYVRTSGEIVCGKSYWVTKTNGLVEAGFYTFDADGKMENCTIGANGIVEENGVKYYYVDGVKTYAGLIEIDGDYYYVRSSGEVVCGKTYWVTKTNGLMDANNYTFGADGKMINPPTNGIVEENGKLFYYENGKKTYAGLIEIDGSYYYVRSSGEVVCGRTYWISKNNDLMPCGNYSFDAEGKMI